MPIAIENPPPTTKPPVTDLLRRRCAGHCGLLAPEGHDPNSYWACPACWVADSFRRLTYRFQVPARVAWTQDRDPDRDQESAAAYDGELAVQQRDPMLLLIVGPNGVGKSVFAAWAAYQWARRRAQEDAERHRWATGSMLWTRWPVLLAEVLDSYRLPVTSAEVLEPYLETPLLVLDDLGARQPTDASQDLLYRLIDTRTEYAPAPMIATMRSGPGGSEQALETLRQYCGAHVMDRLALWEIAYLGGESRRAVPPVDDQE